VSGGRVKETNKDIGKQLGGKEARRNEISLDLFCCDAPTLLSF
jgi:hypothetical protein